MSHPPSNRTAKMGVMSEAIEQRQHHMGKAAQLSPTNSPLTYTCGTVGHSLPQHAEVSTSMPVGPTLAGCHGERAALPKLLDAFAELWVLQDVIRGIFHLVSVKNLDHSVAESALPPQSHSVPRTALASELPVPEPRQGSDNHTTRRLQLAQKHPAITDLGRCWNPFHVDYNVVGVDILHGAHGAPGIPPTQEKPRKRRG